MAKREVIELTCDRCGKVETQTSGEIPKGDSVEFSGKLHSVEVTFVDLCKRCRGAVISYWERIIKKAPDENQATIDAATGKEPTQAVEPEKPAAKPAKLGIFNR